MFLIFVIIWFIWYGTSLKRRQHYSHRANNNADAPFRQAPSSSGHQFSQYDYSAQSSLNRPLAQPGNYGLNQINEDAYAPIGVRTNPAFNGRDELILNKQTRQNSIKSASINAHSINSSSNMQQAVNQCHNHFGIPDEIGSNHSASFVHSYQHRV